MTRTEYVRHACLWLTGLALLSLAAIYAQAALWALSAPLGAAAVVCADAALYVQETARERALWGSPVETAQPCGVSVPGLFGAPLGPCVLPHEHGGPVHQAADGTTWWPAPDDQPTEEWPSTPTAYPSAPAPPPAPAAEGTLGNPQKGTL